MAVMTRDEVETLVTIFAYGEPMPAGELGLTLYHPPRRPDHGTAYETGRRRAQPLVEAGAVERPLPGHYALTEKGRIAVALCISRDPGLRDVFLDEPAPAAAAGDPA